MRYWPELAYMCIYAPIGMRTRGDIGILNGAMGPPAGALPINAATRFVPYSFAQFNYTNKWYWVIQNPRLSLDSQQESK